MRMGLATYVAMLTSIIQRHQHRRLLDPTNLFFNSPGIFLGKWKNRGKFVNKLKPKLLNTPFWAGIGRISDAVDKALVVLTITNNASG